MVNYDLIASNGHIGIKDIKHDIEDTVILEDDTECIINYDDNDAYFELGNNKYYLNEFIKTYY